MNLQIKKYVYLLNDLTGALLGKERQNHEQTLKKLQFWLIFVSISLLLSLIINICLLYFIF